MDPLDRLNIAGDSTYMLMRESTARGWPVWWCTPNDLYVRGGRTWANVEEVTTTADAPHFFRGGRGDVELGEFDLVWMRKDPPFDMEYIFSTYLLELVPPSTQVFNRPSSLRDDNEKIITLRYPELIVPTLITRDIRRAVAFAQEAPDRIVMKPWDGNGGRGVLVSHKGDANLKSMFELLSADGKAAIIVQRYIPEIVLGDKRVILVDGEPIAGMLRVPQPGDHRGNMHAGAIVEPCALSDRDREICAAIAPHLKAAGHLFVGIDIIGGWLTEINVTSPTGIQEMNRLYGISLESIVTDAVATRFAALEPQS
jgi:glutathione synthase